MPGRAVAISALAMGAASALFAVMAILVKSAMFRLPPTEAAFFRFAVGIIGCALAAPLFPLRVHNWRGLILRGLFGGVAALSYFVALAHLPVGVATLLTYTSPVFTALFAALFLGETLSAGVIAALALTTSGVIMVVHGHAAPGHFGFGRWELLGVASSVLSGAAVTTIRYVRKTDNTISIFFFFCMAGLFFTLPTAGTWLMPNGAEWTALLCMGTVSLGAQLLMTYALAWLPAAAAGILMQLTPVFALLLGVVLFGERAVGLALAGSALTFVGVSWGAWSATTTFSRRKRA